MIIKIYLFICNKYYLTMNEECYICFYNFNESFKNGKINFKCNHSICTDCYKNKILKNKIIYCPICNKYLIIKCFFYRLKYKILYLNCFH